MVKKGDTLIEVLLAVGIFSMIAISVVAVMSGGTSSAQTALETTLAREEIDAQAEALRYIHDAYINDKNSENTNLPSVALWKKITSNVYTPTGDEDKDKNILQYAPTECPTNASKLPSGAFILDTRSLDLPGAVAYKSASTDSSIFIPAPTYPRLVFNGDSESLVESGTNNTLRWAEGIYVIAVADKDTTTVLDIDGNPVATGSPAFFDFYIRTCWYGTDAETPSTISTVIRLHNPDVQTQYYKYSRAIYNEFGEQIGNTDGPTYQPTTLEDRTQIFDQPGWDFLGWCYGGTKITKPGDPCTGTIFNETKFYNTDSSTQMYDFYPAWWQIPYTINYDLNGGSWNSGTAPSSQSCTIAWGARSRTCSITMPANEEAFTRSGYEFLGWCTGQVNDANGSCSGKTYPVGQSHTVTAPNDFSNSNPTINLKAIWKESNRIITIRADWTSNTDYDSMMELSAPGTENVYRYASYYTDNIMVEYHNQSYSLVTGAGDGRGYTSGDRPYTNHYENFTINTLGGKYYYYSIRKFNSGNVGNDITVKVTITNPENNKSTTTTYYSKNMGCSGNIWNVFGYVNGKMVTRNTCSDYDYNYTTPGYGMEYGYGR